MPAGQETIVDFLIKMRQISYEDFQKLLEAHKPARISGEDTRLVQDWYEYNRGIRDILTRRIDTQEKERTAKINLARVISKYPHIAADISLDAAVEQLRELMYDEEDRMHTELGEVASQYPGIQTKGTGGYASHLWDDYKRAFSDILVHQAAGTTMRIIPSNRYRSYDQVHATIAGMVDNAVEHGNMESKDKDVYLLWHRCSGNKEILVVDQGEEEFDFDERLKKRRHTGLVHSSCYISGSDFLISHSRHFEYFSIVHNGAKKGTLLRIVLEQTQVPKSCTYLGHKLFEEPPT